MRWFCSCIEDLEVPLMGTYLPPWMFSERLYLSQLSMKWQLAWLKTVQLQLAIYYMRKRFFCSSQVYSVLSECKPIWHNICVRLIRILYEFYQRDTLHGGIDRQSAMKTFILRLVGTSQPASRCVLMTVFVGYKMSKNKEQAQWGKWDSTELLLKERTSSLT